MKKIDPVKNRLPVFVNTDKKKKSIEFVFMFYDNGWFVDLFGDNIQRSRWTKVSQDSNIYLKRFNYHPISAYWKTLWIFFGTRELELTRVLDYWTRLSGYRKLVTANDRLG